MDLTTTNALLVALQKQLLYFEPRSNSSTTHILPILPIHKKKPNFFKKFFNLK